jgi:ketosteroid isomerase-like protein
MAGHPDRKQGACRMEAPRRYGLRWAWLACAWCLVLASGCARTDPEQALRATVAELHAAIEEHDPAAMQQHLAEDFIGNDGLDRDGARRLAAAIRLRYRDLAIDTGPLQVDIEETSAIVRFTAALRGGSGGLLPESARIYEVETGWRRDEGEWLLTSARWTPRL